MATRALSLVARQSLVSTTRRSYQVSAVQRMGALPPPKAPFARSPRRTEPMPENADTVWEDAVAPELALDFDAAHVSSQQAFFTLAGALGGFAALYYGIKFSLTGDQFYDNPATPRSTAIVDKFHHYTWLKDEEEKEEKK